MILNKTSDLDKCVKNSSVIIWNCMQYCLASDVGGERTDGYLTEGQNRHDNFIKKFSSEFKIEPCVQNVAVKWEKKFICHC